MNQKEFNKYVKKIGNAINERLNDYNNLMKRVKSGEIREEDWGHSNWLHEV